jgi:hypothetical protein
MKALAQLALIKSADRQEVSPSMAALSSILPFGSFVHGTVAGHSPREGLREEIGHSVGGIPGNLAGGAIDAVIGGTNTVNLKNSRRKL